MDEWDRAYTKLVGTGDLGPLAKLIKGTSPIPPHIREHLGRMLDPATDSKISDRLFFNRTPALARKMATNQKKIMVGLAVLDAVAQGQRHKRAVTAVAKRFRKSISYVEKSIDLARRLPDSLADFARANPPVWSSTARK
jgi:hypothetical protein